MSCCIRIQFEEHKFTDNIEFFIYDWIDLNQRNFIHDPLKFSVPGIIGRFISHLFEGCFSKIVVKIRLINFIMQFSSKHGIERKYIGIIIENLRWVLWFFSITQSMFSSCFPKHCFWYVWIYEYIWEEGILNFILNLYSSSRSLKLFGLSFRIHSQFWRWLKYLFWIIFRNRQW